MYDYTNKHISFSSGAMTKVGGRSGICPFGVGDERAGNVPRGNVCTLNGSLPLCNGHMTSLCSDATGVAHSANASLAYIGGQMVPLCITGHDSSST